MPSVSSTGLLKSSYPSKDELPCQVVPPIHKPTTKPALPSDFLLVENCSASADIISLAEKAVEESVKTEFIVSLASCGLPYGTATAGSLPPWGGIHALIISHDVPLMRVGFLPVIPSQVTEYATVRKALQNFQACRKQLNQDTIAAVSDEGVYHTVVDIIMNEPETFKDIFPMLGMFHFAKVLPRCAGLYISGSGLNDALIEFQSAWAQIFVNCYFWRSLCSVIQRNVDCFRGN